MPEGNGRQCKGCGGELVGRQLSWCGETCQKDNARAKRLDERYKITVEEYNRIFEAQGGKCGICKKPPKPGKRLAVDHDHKTGKVRGLLDFLCNKRVLGARGEPIIIAMYEYVMDPPAQRIIGDRVAPGRPPKKRRRRTTTRTKAAA